MPSRKMLTRLWMVAVAGAVAGACGGESGGGGEGATSEAPATDPSTTTAQPQPGTPGSSPTTGGGAAMAGGDAALVQQGQQVFTGPGNCQTCHMPNGQGGPLAPNLADNQWLWFEQQPQLDELTALIKTGVTAPKEHPAPMPAMGGGTLSDEQLRAVAVYVLSLSSGGQG